MSLINPREILRIARRLGLSFRVFAFLLILNLASAIFELVGIGMLLPVFELLQSQSGKADQLQGRHWELLRSITGHFGVNVTLELLLGVSFLFIVLRQGFRYFAIRYSDLVQRRMENELRLRAFNRYLRAQTSLQDQSNIGDVVAALLGDLRRGLAVLMSLTQSISTVVQMFAYLGALILLSPIMSFACIAIVTIAAFAARGPLREIRSRGVSMTAINRRLSGFMIERLRHARLIRLSGTEKAEAEAFDTFSRSLSEEALKQKLVSNRMQLSLEPAIVALGYLAIFIGGKLLGLSLERLGLFGICLIRFVPLLRTMLARYSDIVGQMASLEHIDKLMTEFSQGRESKGGSVRFETLENKIQYNHVTFSYSSEEASALHDVTVAIPAHRMTALVGPSGAGKSTFIDMLPRLRDPSSGEIRFDDTPLQSFSKVSLRDGIAVVTQQPQIFNFTVSEHIRYGNDNVTEAQVREAAHFVGASSFIEKMPNGYDTHLGEGGIRLSGGQRQRLDIARAIVRGAQILILDEPTSALDPEAEAVFRDALRVLRRETRLTVIVIAHRLSTVADADQIIVLERGRVTAVGTHEELLAGGGWYAGAYKLHRGQRQLSSGV